MNYGCGLYTGYVVLETRESERVPGRWSFVVRPNNDDPEALRSRGYLNHFTLRPDGRLVGRPFPLGSAAWEVNGGGEDGDGRDEIWVERAARQLRLL
jgi:hypothetical protein